LGGISAGEGKVEKRARLRGENPEGKTQGEKSQREGVARELRRMSTGEGTTKGKVLRGILSFRAGGGMDHAEKQIQRQ